MTTKSSSRLYNIPILEENGTNFQTQKYQIQTVLNIQGLLKIAEGKEQCSEPIMIIGTDESANK